MRERPHHERRRRARPPDDDSDDGGAAVVDFVMLSGLLVLLLMGVLQVAVYFYARNVVASSAADAARYAATLGVDPATGGPRAEQLLAHGLDDNDARAITCTSVPGRDAPTGLRTVTVHCRGRLRLLFLPIGVPLTIDVSSSVLEEQQP